MSHLTSPIPSIHTAAIYIRAYVSEDGAPRAMTPAHLASKRKLRRV